MNKSYIFQKKVTREDANNKTFIDYYLKDEKGNERIVSAVAKFGFRNKLKSTQAVFFREAPLVRELAKASKLQKVDVCYSKYNKKPVVTLASAKNATTSNMMYRPDNNDLVVDEEHSYLNPSFMSLAVLAVLAYTLWFFSKF